MPLPTRPLKRLEGQGPFRKLEVRVPLGLYATIEALAKREEASINRTIVGILDRHFTQRQRIALFQRDFDLKRRWWFRWMSW